MALHDLEDGIGSQISICGSLGEYHTRQILLSERDTVDVLEQVGPFVWHDETGKVHDHYLDHVVVKSDGSRLGLADKAYDRVTPDLEDELKQVRQAAVTGGRLNEVYLVTEYGRNPIDLYNAELFRGCRDLEPEVDEAALRIARSLGGEVPLRDLITQVGFGARGFRALVRLIARGVLQQVEQGKITADTRVTAEGLPPA
jgi:hypothetical protein